MIESIRINTMKGSILGEIHFPERNNKLFPLIIVLTGDTKKGFKGFSVQRFLPLFMQAGYAVCLFDFQGLGSSDGERKDLTLTLGIQNFKTVFERIKKHDKIDVNKITIFASSFGGTVALCSSEIVNQTSKLILRSPCSDLAEAYINEIGFDAFMDWRKVGFNQVNGYNYNTILDCINYNIYKLCKEIVTPCNIVFGEKDEIVPTRQTLLLYDCLNSDKKIVGIKNANHGYSGEECFNELINVVMKWL